MAAMGQDRRSPSDEDSSSDSESDSHKRSRKHKHKRKSQERCPPSGVGKIHEDDFSVKKSQFSAWLQEKNGRNVEDLDAKSLKSYFEKFVKRWNTGKLSKKIYFQGGPFEPQSDKPAAKLAESSAISAAKGAEDEDDDEMVGPMPPKPDQYEREIARETEYASLKRARKDFKKHNEEVAEELVPKETGRDARIDKRRAANDLRREKERDQSPELADKDIFGGGQEMTVELNRRKLAKMQQQAEKKQIALGIIKEYQMKEKQKMEEFLMMARSLKSEHSMWKG